MQLKSPEPFESSNVTDADKLGNPSSVSDLACSKKSSATYTAADYFSKKSNPAKLKMRVSRTGISTIIIMSIVESIRHCNNYDRDLYGKVHKKQRCWVA